MKYKLLIFSTGCVTSGKSHTLSRPQFPALWRRARAPEKPSPKAAEFLKQSLAICKALAALSSLHFHEKDAGSAQFLGPSCANIPGSTLMEAPVHPLPPPAIRQESAAPRLHSSCRLDTPAGWAVALSTFSRTSPCARHRASFWRGPLAAYLLRVDSWLEFGGWFRVCFGLPGH